MKLTVILCLVFQISVLAKAQNVSLHLKSRPLSEVLGQIARQADISFTYGQSVAEISKPVTISVENMPYLDAIRTVLKGQPLSFKVLEDKSIWIFAVSEVKGEQISTNDTIGELEFKGRVLNEDGVPLPGATVQIKSKGKLSITGPLGDYKIKGTSEHKIISISYVGYKTQTVIGSPNNSVIYLTPDATDLGRVVIQGYGTTSKKTSAGNISTISREEIDHQPVQNVMQALQNKVPGLVITQTSGHSAAPFKVEIRGRSSVDGNFSSDPLIIVDGVPQTNVRSIDGDGNQAGAGPSDLSQNGMPMPSGGQSFLWSWDPDDIESVSVLKDAEATAIYGSRGGKGVILINTRRAKPGKTVIEANVSRGFSYVSSYYDMLSASEYVEMRYEAFKNSNRQPNKSNAYDILIWDTTRTTNWQKEFWGKPAQANQYRISLSGGDRFNNYRISGGFDRRMPLNSNSGSDDRATFMFNLTHKTTNNKLNVDLTGMYSYGKNDNISLGGGVLSPPTAPSIFDNNGKLNYAGWAPVSHTYRFGYLLQPYVGKTKLLNSNLKLTYNMLKGVKVTTLIGYSFHNLGQISKIPIASLNPASDPLGSASFGSNNGTKLIIEPTIEYQGKVGFGELQTIIGGTFQSVSQDGNRVIGDGYTNDNLLGTIANAPNITGVDNVGQYKYAAIFFRAIYNVQDKYILTISGRRDGSSRFGPGNRFGNFGAIAGAWVFSEEKAIKESLGWVSFGKIRGSMGVTGSDNVGDYAFLTRWTSNNAQYLNSTAFYPVAHANPNLQWQTDKKMEIGLELGFLDNRITAAVSWYRNRSDNQLLDYSLPIMTGFSSVSANFPANVQNSGWEPTVGVKIFKTTDFELSVNAQVGINRNRLVSFPRIEETPYFGTYVVGMPLTIRKLLVLKGVDPQTGEYVYADMNKDGEISTSSGVNDDRVWKDLTIKYDGGFGVEARYKNWQFSTVFGVRNQLGQNALFTGSTPGTANNIPREMMKRWKKPGDITSYARFTVTPSESDYNFVNSDGKFTNASFVRLNNIYLAYNLPKKLQSNMKFKTFKLYMRGQNLLVISKYKGSDPETQSFGGLPPLTTVDLGIQIGL